MKYEKLKNLKESDFRRHTGVKRTTFNKMIEILNPAYAKKHSKGGRNPKLIIEDMLLASLEYWREYRTYFHIANDYGIAEGNMYKVIRWVEDTLIKDGTFSLPGKKTLYGDEIEYEVILIDATESPIERPKKNKGSSTQEKRTDTH